MNVIKIDETTFLVLNEKSTAGYPRQQIVTWDREAGVFRCTCEYYVFNKNKQPRMACKHIRAVFQAYGVEVKVSGDPEPLTNWLNGSGKMNR